MKLKAMVRGDKLELEGLSWRENVVMGEYLGVLATGEQLLELLPAFQEEERWREVMLKLELRVCRGKRPYACIWPQQESVGGGDYLRLRLRELGLRLYTGNGKDFVPYRDGKGVHGYDWQGALASGVVCFYDEEGAHGYAQRNVFCGQWKDLEQVYAAMPLRLSEKAAGTAEVYAAISTDAWEGWRGYLRGVIVQGEWSVVDGRYLMRVAAGASKLEEVVGYAMSRGIKLLTAPAGTEFGWRGKGTRVLVERGYEHPLDLRVVSGWGGDRILVYLGSGVEEWSAPEAVLDWEGWMEMGTVEWREEWEQTPAPDLKVEIELGWALSMVEGNGEEALIGSEEEAWEALCKSEEGAGRMLADGENSVALGKGLGAGKGKYKLQQSGVDARVYVATGLELTGIAVNSLVQVLGLGEEEVLLLWPEDGVTAMRLEARELRSWLEAVEFSWDEVVESVGDWGRRYCRQNLTELVLAAAETEVTPGQVGERREKGDGASEVAGDAELQAAAEGYERSGSYFRAGEIWESLGNKMRAMSAYARVAGNEAEYVRARVYGWSCRMAVAPAAGRQEVAGLLRWMQVKEPELEWLQLREYVQRVLAAWPALGDEQEGVEIRVKGMLLRRAERDDEAAIYQELGIFARKYFGDSGLLRRLVEDDGNGNGNGDGEERYGLPQEVWEQCRYQHTGKWLLDMSSEYWARLSVAEQQEYARCYQQGYARHIGLAVERTFRVNGVEIEMRLIPPGRWWMGSPENEVGRDDDERQHRVVISQGYWLQKTAITQGQWRQATGEQPWLGQRYAEDNERHPATYISWEDIGKKLLARWGEKWGIPSEAQWEYACRAGTTTKYYWGDSMDGAYCWYDGNAWYKGEEYAYQVGQKQANAFGLYDMSGNVWEWCQDWYDRSYYSKGENDNPRGPSTGSSRVLRGGSFVNGAGGCRSAHRNCHGPGRRGYRDGVRFAAQCRTE